MADQSPFAPTLEDITSLTAGQPTHEMASRGIAFGADPMPRYGLTGAPQFAMSPWLIPFATLLGMRGMRRQQPALTPGQFNVYMDARSRGQPPVDAMSAAQSNPTTSVPSAGSIPGRFIPTTPPESIGPPSPWMSHFNAEQRRRYMGHIDGGYSPAEAYQRVMMGE